MFKRLLAVSAAMLLTLATAAIAAELREDHPTTYTVKKGDTLWDIAGRFLKKPWLWPEIWQANPQVKNPHLIYPGDVLSLVYIDGEPVIQSEGPQIGEAIESYGWLLPTPAKCVVAVGGLSVNPQMMALRGGADFLVATPGRLLDLMAKNAVSLAALGTLVLRLSVLLESGRTFNLVVINALRASGDARFPFYLGVLSMWGVWVPLAWFFGLQLGWGLLGVWAAGTCDEWCRGLLMYRRWRRRQWLKYAHRTRDGVHALRGEAT